LSPTHSDVTTGDPNPAPLERCTRAHREDPGIRAVHDRLGDKWSLLVIVELTRGPLRFRQLQHAVGGISQRMLTLTVRRLERDGLVRRTVYPTVRWRTGRTSPGPRPITTALTQADPCVRSWREPLTQPVRPPHPRGGAGARAVVRRVEGRLPRIVPTTLTPTGRRLLTCSYEREAAPDGPSSMMSAAT